MKDIILDFGEFELAAKLFESTVAQRFAEAIPCSISLVQWGGELYGPVESALGSDSPVPEIPPGGIAYTDNGNYLCIFFGQRPAWPVEYIGQIDGESWKRLLDEQCNSVTVSVKDIP